VTNISSFDSSMGRDYYQELFSPDTPDSFVSLSSNEEDEFDLPRFGCDEDVTQIPLAADACDVENIETLLQNLNDQFEIGNEDTANNENKYASVGTDTNTTPISGEIWDESITIDDDNASLDSMSELEFLSEEDMIRLLRDNSEDIIAQRSKQYNTRLINPGHNTEMECPDKIVHKDRIGTFNIQNQYEHTLAAKLFLEGEFTFLALQEPFASTSSIGDAWGACRRYELNSARIACIETHHQIIMYDTWRWGGKMIENTASLLDGRVLSMAFGFSNNQSLGIISVYGVSMGGLNAEQISEKNDMRKTIIFAIQKIRKRWRKSFPSINIMVLGDLQETISTSNMDNLGKCRYDVDPQYSILKTFSSSFSSIVRDRIEYPKQYLTRFGSEGARGIDHILFPKHDSAQTRISDTGIDQTLGSFYFPSDHKLLYCSLLRNGPNNVEEGESSTKFQFRDIFQIKVARTGKRGDELILDPTQFKECLRYRKQKDLYQKIQSLTHDKSDASHFHLHDIESSIKSLYRSLWNDGVTQDALGPNNNLVDISERQAAELSAIVNRFDLGIKDIMSFLELSKEHDQITDMARTRKNIVKFNSFKLFSNLPISTKLRYLRNWVKEKHRSIKRYVKSIQEFELLHRSNNNISGDSDHILRNWTTKLNTQILRQKAHHIHSMVSHEFEERDRHIEAVFSHNNKAQSAFSRREFRSSGNNLDLSDKTIKLINFWLNDAGCSQCFNTTSNKDRFAFLVEDMESWVEHLKSFNVNSMDWTCQKSLCELKEKLNNSSDDLGKLEQKIGRAQSTYRSNTIEYLLKVNRIEDFTQKVRTKSREAPTAHTEIWDPNLKSFRTCQNEAEELTATGEYHGRWMGNSEASETCAFAKLDYQGLLGIRGVQLCPDRKVTFNDIPNLIKNGDRLADKDKQAFVDAHGKHTAELFRAKEVDHAELHYPFYLNSKQGEMNTDREVAELFWKSISSIPGKARYDGFQMAVVGRFGSRWQSCLLNICKLILVMRYIPKKLKSIARFPIPKPGKINEYRPISLCHDLYCFINSISTKFSSQGILDAGILHEGIAAYVKGKGCAMLVGVEQGVREDCLESGIPMSQTDEDEEKFFDRIPVEILLAAMRVNGFPTQGYVELKASGMGAKTVEIITAKGVAHARFVCGLEQGNPDSPTIANLVIKFKHDIWCNILTEIDNNSNNSLKSDKIGRLLSTGRNKDAYKFHISDKADGSVQIDRIGYCDDNTRYTSSMDEGEVILATKEFIKRSGDLSLVTKIGRKGSKSEIHYYNLSAEIAIQLDQVNSFAWSFLTDGPVWEKVPHKIQLQQKELAKAYKLVDFHNLDELQQQEFLQVFQPQPHKHLGLCSTLTCDNSSASTFVVNKIKERLISLKLRTMGHEAQKVCSNMLCTTVHSYAPLQMGHSTEALLECDKLLISQVMKRKGLSKTDAKHCIFLDESAGGYGFKSFLEVDLISNARELEIVLNGSLIDSEVIRARSAAYLLRHNRPDDEISYKNFTGSAIEKLADYGIHLRDSMDGIVNFILSYYNNQKTFRSIGDDSYTGTKGFSIGLGKPVNRRIAFGSKLHVFLKRAFTKEGFIKGNLIIPENLNPKISLHTLKRLSKLYRCRRFEDTANSYNFWEWKNKLSDGYWLENVEQSTCKWTYINFSSILKTKFPSNFWMMTQERIHEEIILLSTIHNRHNDLAHFLDKSAFPPFISVDGSHIPQSAINSEIDSSTSSSAVLCCPNIKEGESLHSKEWVNRVSIPILARISQLPKTYGTVETDIAHGEAVALCMGMEMFAPGYSKIMVTDSAAIRNVALNIRDIKPNTGRNRNYIRKIVSGVSKHLSARMEENLIIKSDPDDENIYNFKQNQNSRMQTMSNLCEEWIQIDEGGNSCTDSNWKKSYFDKHPTTTIFKIDSHQLGKDGRNVNQKQRYSKIIPNLFLASCNHHADWCAEISHNINFKSDIPRRNIIIPASKLRFFFTWNGLGIDRHISSFLERKFQLEKLSHIQAKATQGLPWRMLPKSSLSWNTLLEKGGLFRSVRGLSRCHTRSLYKSLTYRRGWIETIKQDNESTCVSVKKSNLTWIQELSSCKWCSNSIKAKGNRTHAQLFCQHIKLREFRKRMTQLIEQKLTRLVQLIHETQSLFASRLFLQDVESTLRALHSLHNSEDTNHMTYRTRSEWMREENIPSWKELLQSTIPIYSAIFGFSPVMEEGIPTDAFLNRAHCINFGFIPLELESCIRKVGLNAKKFCSDDNMFQIINQQYTDIWKEVKEINIARTTGLHRIIGEISKDIEKGFKEKFEFNDGTYKGMKKMLKKNTIPHMNLSPILKRKDSPILRESHKRIRKRVRFAERELPMKACTGITCGIHTKWKPKGSMPNFIPGQQKHCLRCSKQCTALRKSANVLRKCHESDKGEKKNELVNHIDETFNKRQFTATFTKIQQIVTTEDTSPNPKTKKAKSCTDTEKLFLKTLSKSIATQTDRFSPPELRISTAIGNIDRTEKNIDTFLKDDLKRYKKIQNDILNEKSYNQKHIEIEFKKVGKQSKQQPLKEIIWQSNKFQDSQIRSRIQTEGYNQLVGGDAIQLAIMNLRNTAPQGTFIGNAATSKVLSSCTSSNDWIKFAPCFGDTLAINKPNGIYLLPLFSGSSEFGHWTLGVVEKRKKFCRVWVIDSLGRGTTTGTIFDSIKKVFSRTRVPCKGFETLSIPQTENECGPRMLRGMVSICEAIRANDSMEEALKKAESVETAQKNYDSLAVRRKAAMLMQVSEETKRSYERKIQKMRQALKRNRDSKRVGVKGDIRTHMNDEAIDLC